MIAQIITTYLITVTNGYQALPVTSGSRCECVRHSRSTECNIGFILSNGDVLTVVTTTINGSPVSDQVTVTCKQ